MVELDGIEMQFEIQAGIGEDGAIYGWFLCLSGRRGDLRQMIRSPIKRETDAHERARREEMLRQMVRWFKEHQRDNRHQVT